jgi:hypothetical protein
MVQPLLAMKYYITLFCCFGLGVVGFLYSQRKSALQAIDPAELDNARQELAHLTNKLAAIKTESENADLMPKEKSDQRDLEQKRNQCLLHQRNL